MNDAFIIGFVKKAADAGYTQEQALSFIKAAALAKLAKEEDDRDRVKRYAQVGAGGAFGLTAAEHVHNVTEHHKAKMHYHTTYQSHDPKPKFNAHAFTGITRAARNTALGTLAGAGVGALVNHFKHKKEAALDMNILAKRYAARVAKRKPVMKKADSKDTDNVGTSTAIGVGAATVPNLATVVSNAHTDHKESMRRYKHHMDKGNLLDKPTHPLARSANLKTLAKRTGKNALIGAAIGGGVQYLANKLAISFDEGSDARFDMGGGRAKRNIRPAKPAVQPQTPASFSSSLPSAGYTPEVPADLKGGPPNLDKIKALLAQSQGLHSSLSKDMASIDQHMAASNARYNARVAEINATHGARTKSFNRNMMLGGGLAVGGLSLLEYMKQKRRSDILTAKKEARMLGKTSEEKDDKPSAADVIDKEDLSKMKKHFDKKVDEERSK